MPTKTTINNVFKKPLTQKILALWGKDPKIWLRWKEITDSIYKDYKIHPAQTSRDLKILTKLGVLNKIVENDENSNNVITSYKPTEKYWKELTRQWDKLFLDNFSLDDIDSIYLKLVIAPAIESTFYGLNPINSALEEVNARTELNEIREGQKKLIIAFLDFIDILYRSFKKLVKIEFAAMIIDELDPELKKLNHMDLDDDFLKLLIDTYGGEKVLNCYEKSLNKTFRKNLLTQALVFQHRLKNNSIERALWELGRFETKFAKKILEETNLMSYYEDEEEIDKFLSTKSHKDDDKFEEPIFNEEESNISLSLYSLRL